MYPLKSKQEHQQMVENTATSQRVSCLELSVALHSVGVVAIPRIVRADGGLRVGHIPGLGAQHAQEGGGVHGPSAHLSVVGQPHGAPHRRPVLLQPGDGLLESWCIGIGYASRCLCGARGCRGGVQGSCVGVDGSQRRHGPKGIAPTNQALRAQFI